MRNVQRHTLRHMGEGVRALVAEELCIGRTTDAEAVHDEQEDARHGDHSGRMDSMIEGPRLPRWPTR